LFLLCIDLLLSETGGVAAESERLQSDESNAKRRRPNEPESASSVRTYSLLELQRLVQASDAQLKSALSNLDALSIDEPDGSKWRVLDAPYADEVFDLVLATLTQLSVNMFEAPGGTAADLDRLCDDLAAQDYPRFVIQHVLRMHASTASTDDGVVLDGPKVARFRAQQIFRACSAGQLFPSAAFVSGWADMLPRGVTADVQLLRGMALMEQHPTHGSVYRFLPAASLPPAAAPRFSRLLKERAKWTLDEIDPYIRDLVAPGQTIEQLLLKNMRVIKTDKSILYGAK
jgi:sister chromatid cohesion protein DCC1